VRVTAEVTTTTPPVIMPAHEPIRTTLNAGQVSMDLPFVPLARRRTGVKDGRGTAVVVDTP
jgi:hypothetical protein